MKTYSDASSCNLWFKSIFAICCDKLYIFSSVIFCAWGCLNVAWISSSVSEEKQ